MQDRLVLHVVAASVTSAILAPLAKPGYVLRYDMNFVPRQPMRVDLLAPVDTPPRAVPLDAAVSLANTVVPGWLLQRLVLAAVLWAAVVGAARLIPTDSLVVRVIAGVFYGWTPYLAERLLIGQWGLLIAYAAMPWLAIAALRVRDRTAGGWPRLVVAAGLCALTPTGGLLAALVCAALLPWRRWAAAAAVLVVVNSPWLVAALVSRAGARSDPAGVEVFAARAENWGGALLALLGTGGIWNGQTTPVSRSSPLVPLLTCGLLALAVVGYRVLWRHDLHRLGIAALAGLTIAALSTVGPGMRLLSWAVREVPGAGILRDAQKFVLPYALLLAVCVALGAQRVAARLPVESGRIALAGVLLLTVAGMADLAYGGAGALTPVRYPADWAAVARIIGERPGPVLSLPLSEYRRYEWNDDRPVLDPAVRFLPAPVVTDDILVVGGRAIAGEDPRLPPIRARLASGLPVADGDFRWVLVQHRGDVGAAVEQRSLLGLHLAYAGRHLTLYRSDAPVESPSDSRRRLPVIAAEIAALLALIAAMATMAARARR